MRDRRSELSAKTSAYILDLRTADSAATRSAASSASTLERLSALSAT
jgi:hypothetical protein